MAITDGMLQKLLGQYAAYQRQQGQSTPQGTAASRMAPPSQPQPTPTTGSPTGTGISNPTIEDLIKKYAAGYPGSQQTYQQYGASGPLPGGVGNSFRGQGTSVFYDDSWLQMLKSLQQGEGGLEEFTGNLMREFRGSPKDMERFMRTMGPMIPALAFGTKGYKSLQDVAGQGNDAIRGVMDYQTRGAEDLARTQQAFGTAAGQIGQAGRMAQSVGEQRLGRMGLGRSAARAGLASKVAAQAGGQQADLWSNLYQSHMDRKQGFLDRAGAMGAQANQQAFDASRGLAGMMVDAIPAQRQQNKSNSDDALIGGAAELAAGIGSAIALCWVAREVIPERWLDVRAYMLNDAPAELLEKYATHGPALAERVKADPALRSKLLPVMLKFADLGRRHRAA